MISIPQKQIFLGKIHLQKDVADALVLSKGETKRWYFGTKGRFVSVEFHLYGISDGFRENGITTFFYCRLLLFLYFRDELYFNLFLIDWILRVIQFNGQIKKLRTSTILKCLLTTIHGDNNSNIFLNIHIIHNHLKLLCFFLMSNHVLID